jgi:hypothetical protein
MFGDSFLQVTGTLLGIFVFAGLTAGLAFTSLHIYRAGQKFRIELEKRAGVLEAVEKKLAEEDAEIKIIDARKRALGRD